MEKLDTCGTQEATNNKECSTKFEQIENTPFHIYGDDEEGYVLVMGTNRLTEKAGWEETIKEAQEITWDRILQVMMVIAKSAVEGKY